MIKILFIIVLTHCLSSAQTYILKDIKTQGEVGLSVRQDPATSSINLRTNLSGVVSSEAVLKNNREMLKINKINDYFLSILFKVKTSWEQNDLAEALFVVHNGRLVNALLLDRESGYSQKTPTTKGGFSFSFLKYENRITLQSCNGQWVADIQEVWNEENAVDGKSVKKAWESNYKLAFSDEYSIFYNCVVSRENIKLFNKKSISNISKQNIYMVLLRASQRSFDGNAWSQVNVEE